MKNITNNQNGEQSKGGNASATVQGLVNVVAETEINNVRNQDSLSLLIVWVAMNATGTSCQTVIQSNLGYNGSHPATRRTNLVLVLSSARNALRQLEPSDLTMAIIIKSKFVVPTAGEQAGKIVSLVPVTQDSKGTKVNDLVLTVELDNGKDAAGAPFRLEKVYDLNLKGVGIFKRDVQTITGKPIKDSELESFDEQRLVGRAVKLSVPKITALPKDGFARFGTFVGSAQPVAA